MPTGVHLRDVRKQLFDAAGRVLLRDGPNALTSRAVTAEADVAKGVLHRHFTDFDAFLAELVSNRIARLRDQAALLQASAGTRTVAENLVGALTELFDPTSLALVSLVLFRNELRTRLRRPSEGLPLLTEAQQMLATYLTNERSQGRIAADTEVDSLSLALIGAGHLLFATRPRNTLPDAKDDELAKMVHTIIADALQRRLL